MPTVDLVVEGAVSESIRAKQLAGMFDMPPQKKARLEWRLNAPLEQRPWTVGLITGPSGAGKSTLARHLFGEGPELRWGGAGVIDDFDSRFGIQAIADVCQAVGFNTIPAWLRPYSVLSTGEKFRASLARTILESDPAKPIVFDEFTSVVDRQVGKIASHAVQKYCRKHNRQFVAVSCHYDIIDWLQPDWIIDAAARTFEWRCLQRRPTLAVTISPVPYSAWQLFAPFHYMSAELHRAARPFCLFVNDIPASIVALVHRPISRGDKAAAPIWGVSRAVTLPDYQGLGLIFVLLETVAAWYTALGTRVRMYPAHPALVRAMDRSSKWALVKAPGTYTRVNLSGSTAAGRMGGRPNAVFEYAGPAGDRAEAQRILSYWDLKKAKSAGPGNRALKRPRIA
jgi:GNAT superfamily N-acetyltransferase